MFPLGFPHGHVGRPDSRCRVALRLGRGGPGEGQGEPGRAQRRPCRQQRGARRPRGRSAHWEARECRAPAGAAEALSEASGSKLPSHRADAIRSPDALLSNSRALTVPGGGLLPAERHPRHGGPVAVPGTRSRSTRATNSSRRVRTTPPTATQRPARPGAGCRHPRNPLFLLLFLHGRSRSSCRSSPHRVPGACLGDLTRDNCRYRE